MDRIKVTNLNPALVHELFDEIYRHLGEWLPETVFADYADDLAGDIMDRILPIRDALLSGEYLSLIETRRLRARERKPLLRMTSKELEEDEKASKLGLPANGLASTVAQGIASSRNHKVDPLVSK